MFSAIGDQNPERLDPTEEIIIQSTDEQYQHARAFFRFMTSMRGVEMLSDLEIGHDAEATQDALKATLDSLRGDPRWAASSVFHSLLLIRRFPTDFIEHDIEFAIKDFQSSNLSFSEWIRLLLARRSKSSE